ncbi:MULTISPECIES: hypothetical protein [unclassified Burkholderia]|uniref:hypothetical protein n=1 Tax=unclassified Burkholderia TaxID=2613784 RepID=UPI000AFAED41|nr:MULTISPECIES: hypothetical protein [unclassified Burkholderia]
MQSASIGKSGTNTSALYGVGGDVNAMVQGAYPVDPATQFAWSANAQLRPTTSSFDSTAASLGLSTEQALRLMASSSSASIIDSNGPTSAVAYPVPTPYVPAVEIPGGPALRPFPVEYGEVRALPPSLRDRLSDPSVGSTPGGAILGAAYSAVENLVGNTAALFSPYGLNPVSGEMLSPEQLQRTKEDLIINAGSLGIGGVEGEAAALVRQQGQAMLRSAGEAFVPQFERLVESTTPALRTYVVPEGTTVPLGPPTPRINVSDEFVVRTSKNGSVSLQFGDPEGIHGLVVNVDKQGVLGFNIRSAPGGSSFSTASGTDMFASAMQRLEQDGVQVNAIRGTWISGTDSVNAAQYASNLSKGMTPQQAAANTWTGRIAARYGFTNVGVPNTGYSATTVIFGR